MKILLKQKKILYNCLFLIVATSLMLLIGCSNVVRDIPAGYIGKKLTPSGWDKEILEAGQVDIGIKHGNGTYTSLVLLEISSVSTKEGFGQSENGGEDHRILVGKTPVTVDAYVRMIVPTDKDQRNAVFAQVTPENCGDRVSKITVAKLYAQFAQMDVRSGIREVLQKQTDVNYVTTHLDEFNDKLGTMAIKMFERSGVPLLVQNVTLSNVKMDETIWAAENKKSAAIAEAEVINTIGTALRKNPEYLLVREFDTYEKIASKIGTFTIIKGNAGGIVMPSK